MIETNIIVHPGSGLLMAEAQVNNDFTLSLAIDTGATHTTIDSNILHIMGFDEKVKSGTTMIENGNGIVMTSKYIIYNLKMLGITKLDFEVQAYDFLSHGILSEYDGVIGLDFLRSFHFCIDTLNQKFLIHN